MTDRPLSVDSVLDRRKVLVCCGTGGVGKTTVSAALAMRAASRGRRAVVITIDPAKRLATALGLTRLGDTPTDLTEKTKGVTGSGCLHAIVPDTRRTFEQFVATLAPDAATAERVIRNPIFQIFAREFSGTNEYMALEKLHATVNALGRYDCIVLDTPPSRNTLAFLDAPKLLAAFFEERLIRWLVLPTNRIVSSGMKTAFGVLERLTGSGFMSNLFDFASALFEVRVKFTANLQQITRLLESPETGFLMVAGPTPDAVPELRHFISSVREHRFHFDGLVLNRSLGHLPPDPAETLSREARRAVEIVAAIREREEQVVAALGRETTLLARLPELARDVHSLEDLTHVATALR